MKRLLLNAGAQHEFVYNDYRASAFIGGLGSGKTYALNARALILAQQPKRGYWGPRGVLAAINHPVLADVVLPQFLEMVDDTGLLLDFLRAQRKAILVPCNDQGVPDRKLVKRNGEGAAEILFRSLDTPNWMRGLELSFFGIDEGRHLTGESWDVLYGRLRQQGYKHRGFVCSTPNGYDWMWSRMHPDSPNRLADSHWWGAPTFDNKSHLPSSYIDSLLATYEGRFLRQEVYGEFVGVIEGAVFFEWDMAKHIDPTLRFNRNLPLYTAWDFGMGDLGVVAFVQVDWVKVKPPGASAEVEVPKLYILDVLEAKERTSREWADIVREFSDTEYGRQPDMNICDPAGRQRNISTGRSIVQDLDSFGMKMTPAPKKPVDYAIRILNNMMAGDRVIVSQRAERMAAAFASHKWPVDTTGTKTGANPVHDWTSHFADAIRYLVSTLLYFSPKRIPAEPDQAAFTPDQWGYVQAQLMKEPTHYLGSEDYDGYAADDIEWEPASLGG